MMDNQLTRPDDRLGGDLIIIEQLPVIKERLAALSEDIDLRVANALALECSEENKQAAKNVRSQLNKEFEAFEERRKAVKTAVLTPYYDFEDAYKKYVTEKYKPAIAQVGKKIDTVEEEQKRKLREGVEEYYNEYAASKNLEFPTFDVAGIKVGVSDNPTKLKKQIKAFIDRICDDIALIETQERKAEILVEYRKTLNASQAITTVVDRYRAIEEQRKRQEEIDARRAAEAETVKRVETVAPPVAMPLAPPTISAEPEPTYTVAFTAYGTKDVIAGLVQYMRANNIEFKQIDLKNIKNDEEAKSA